MTNGAAATVAEMESENVILREQLADLRTKVAVLENENNRLTMQVADVEDRYREEMRKNAEVETVLQNVSSGLVASINRMQRNREIAREVRTARLTRPRDHSPQDDGNPSPGFSNGRETPLRLGSPGGQIPDGPTFRSDADQLLDLTQH